MILKTLKEFSKHAESSKVTSEDRLQKAIEHFKAKEFTRKDYISLNKGISTATASRDLESGVKLGYIKRIGTKANAFYKLSRG